MKNKSYYRIIFSKSWSKAFAKYIYKERKDKIPFGTNLVKKGYEIEYIRQHFLQQLVLEDNKLKYIERFLKD